jgi:23S rRNA pseudouridine955/2504/2580 synthase/23S rRNA pseudouridine1911/1915/1917 synthase
MLSEGRVSIGGIAAGAGRIVRKGEIVAFDPPPLEEPEVDSSYDILFEDEDFLIVDKSGNLPSHPCGRFFKHSLWYLLRERYGELGIATRLDRETSGLVLACRKPASAAYAEKLLAAGDIAKEYLVLAHGRFPSSFEARGYLVGDESSAIRLKRRFVEEPPSGGTKAEACATSFELLGFIDPPSDDGRTGRVGLLIARPRTGRTHQIRATLSSLGFPVLGDKLYGLDEGCFVRQFEGRLNQEDLTRLILPNQALHCSSLSFKTLAGRSIRVKSQPRWGSPFAEELAALL